MKIFENYKRFSLLFMAMGRNPFSLWSQPNLGSLFPFTSAAQSLAHLA
jgi:hypothetical protein